MAQKPNVLIFGGCNSLSPQLALHLVPLQGEPLVNHIRMVDKFSLFPQTTYVSKEFIKLLQDRSDVIEYRQANLTVPATVTKCFTDPAPNGQPYTHVFDLSGETAYDRPTAIQISHTFNVSLNLAREAAKQNVKAYIRNIGAVYDHVTEKKKYKEDDVDGWKPLGVRGVWWHETMRAVASVPNLPLVVIRKAYAYGPGETHGEVTQTILLGLVYKHLDEAMKFLWAPKLKRHTVHTKDVAGVAWTAAQWAAGLDREKMNALAGVSLPPSGDDSVKGVPGAIQKEQGGVVVPLFNLVDDNDWNQENTAAVISKVFGIKFGFHGIFASQLAKLRLETVVEDINGVHMEEWTKIIATYANPPVPFTPLSPYALQYQLEKHGCALDGEKLKKVLGYKFLHPYFTEETVRETIESYRVDGIWPQTDKYPPF
ncbi:hypothetical protein M408DRAFT_290788 [Serendipita vermifera MAFF 305830]|uniref:NAD-dependent epimerase/dehydratase domain-containing protein n=1 Tax=Serendipita vermifera MAFF 305830 TaxID=933852 RepID=A0A0C3AQN6_SERVB|nr:hypothetical protein M408DRAFT_290788 [Serendipita vermifera MAFF 305830]